MSARREVAPAAVVRGTVRVPGDKSASHRALMLSALAAGTSVVRGISPGEDVAATAAIVSQLGARVTHETGLVSVTGSQDGLVASGAPLDCANSGTTMRLMAGVLSAVPGRHTLVGDASLSARPMDRVALPLGLMGATITGRGERVTAPLTIVGSAQLRAIDFDVPVPSAQVKSAILLAGLSAAGHTVVHEALRTRTTTEDMLVHAGVTVHSVDEGAGRTVTLTPGRPGSREWLIPADPSQAAFFVVLGLVHADAEVEVTGVDLAPERTGFLSVLRRMGGRVEVDADGATTSILATSSDLVATEVRASEVPSVDEVPVLVVAAAAARGVTAFRDVGELRVKESDCFAESIRLASALGCRAWG
ncbi:MAG: 3-phosphoshikimate 1-carboxyvinyltransferase, partial [Acidobacteriota bacterium]|nr:3-phosphoshikimate 1-carboxyvinyltransferase [Acidobacteriota bacterium]